MIVTLSSAAPDTTARPTAFKYLCDNLRSKYPDYNPDNFRHIAFIPAENEDGTCLKTLGNVRGFPPTVLPANIPFQVFLGIRWKALGFSVIHDSYRTAPVTELGVQQHPPTSTLIQLLETTPPPNAEKARQWFEALWDCISSRCYLSCSAYYYSNCVPGFSQEELTRLSELPIVPTGSSTAWQHLAPIQCYLGKGDGFHTKLFVFVDFGFTGNGFLRACGSKNEPSVQDIAESLVEDPERFYNLAGGHEGYASSYFCLN
jgi:hypothetical protein